MGNKTVTVGNAGDAPAAAQVPTLSGNLSANVTATIPSTTSSATYAPTTQITGGNFPYAATIPATTSSATYPITPSISSSPTWNQTVVPGGASTVFAPTLQLLDVDGAIVTNCVVNLNTWPNGTTIVNTAGTGAAYNATAAENDYNVLPSGATAFKFDAATNKITFDHTTATELNGNGTTGWQKMSWEFVVRPDNTFPSFYWIGYKDALYITWDAPNGIISFSRFDAGYVNKWYYSFGGLTFTQGAWYTIQASWDCSVPGTKQPPILKINDVTKTAIDYSVGTVSAWANDSTTDLTLWNWAGAASYVTVALTRIHSAILSTEEFTTNYDASKWRYQMANLASPNTTAVTSTNAATVDVRDVDGAIAGQVDFLGTSFPDSGTTIANKGTAGATLNGTAAYSAFGEYGIWQSGERRWEFSQAAVDYLDVPHNARIDTVTNFTFETAFNTYVNHRGPLLNKGDKGISIYISGTPGNVFVSRYDNGGVNYRSYETSSGIIDTGHCYYIVVKWDCTDYDNTPEVWISEDGGTLTSQGMTNTSSGITDAWFTDSSYNLRFGANEPLTWQSAQTFLLWRFHDQLLTSDEISANFNASKWRIFDCNIPVPSAASTVSSVVPTLRITDQYGAVITNAIIELDFNQSGGNIPNTGQGGSGYNSTNSNATAEQYQSGAYGYYFDGAAHLETVPGKHDTGVLLSNMSGVYTWEFLIYQKTNSEIVFWSKAGSQTEVHFGWRYLPGGGNGFGVTHYNTAGSNYDGWASDTADMLTAGFHHIFLEWDVCTHNEPTVWVDASTSGFWQYSGPVSNWYDDSELDVKIGASDTGNYIYTADASFLLHRLHVGTLSVDDRTANITAEKWRYQNVNITAPNTTAVTSTDATTVSSVSGITWTQTIVPDCTADDEAVVVKVDKTTQASCPGCSTNCLPLTTSVSKGVTLSCPSATADDEIIAVKIDKTFEVSCPACTVDVLLPTVRDSSLLVISCPACTADVLVSTNNVIRTMSCPSAAADDLSPVVDIIAADTIVPITYVPECAAEVLSPTLSISAVLPQSCPEVSADVLAPTLRSDTLIITSCPACTADVVSPTIRTDTRLLASCPTCTADVVPLTLKLDTVITVSCPASSATALVLALNSTPTLSCPSATADDVSPSLGYIIQAVTTETSTEPMAADVSLAIVVPVAGGVTETPAATIEYVLITTAPVTLATVDTQPAIVEYVSVIDVSVTEAITSAEGAAVDALMAVVTEATAEVLGATVEYVSFIDMSVTTATTDDLPAAIAIDVNVGTTAASTVSDAVTVVSDVLIDLAVLDSTAAALTTTESIAIALSVIDSVADTQPVTVDYAGLPNAPLTSATAEVSAVTLSFGLVVADISATAVTENVTVATQTIISLSAIESVAETQPVVVELGAFVVTVTEATAAAEVVTVSYVVVCDVAVTSAVNETPVATVEAVLDIPVSVTEAIAGVQPAEVLMWAGVDVSVLESIAEVQPTTLSISQVLPVTEVVTSTPITSVVYDITTILPVTEAIASVLPATTGEEFEVSVTQATAEVHPVTLEYGIITDAGITSAISEISDLSVEYGSVISVAAVTSIADVLYASPVYTLTVDVQCVEAIAIGYPASGEVSSQGDAPVTGAVTDVPGAVHVVTTGAQHTHVHGSKVTAVELSGTNDTTVNLEGRGDSSVNLVGIGVMGVELEGRNDTDINLKGMW